MPSKGVDYYSFIGIDNTTITFSGPKVGGTNTKSDNFTKHHLEIDSGNISGLFNYTGPFEWDITRNGKTVYSRTEDISSFTGNLEGGNLSPLMKTPAVVTSDYVVTYGLYDAGSGMFGLTNADQGWVTIIPNLSQWMGRLVSIGSVAEDKPFSTFVLAAAHDTGMNTMDGINVVLSGVLAAAFEGIIITLFPPAAAVIWNAHDILLDIAMTQKESTTDMLSMGVRYFDFRPAYLVPGVRELASSKDDTLYHTHLVVPGQRFDSFLGEVVNFLKNNKTEIVVVRTCADGIKLCDVPSHDTISKFAQAAVKGSGIVIGDSGSFQKKINELRRSNTRLILVMDNSKYDSYSDDVYKTLDPNRIVDAFSKMTTNGQSGSDFTVLQCQGTCTGIAEVIAYAITAANDSTAPLMSTKAKFDTYTLPWIRDHALDNLKAQRNIVLMNDFIDGATTYTAYQLSQARFAGQTKIKGVSEDAVALPSTVTASVPHVHKEPAHVALTLQGAQHENARQEKKLEEYQAKHAHLDVIVAASKLVQDQGRPVDEVTLRVQEAVKKEWAETIEAQREVVAITKKRVAEAEAGNL